MTKHHAGETKLTLTLAVNLRRQIDTRRAKENVTISSFMHTVTADFLRRHNGKRPRYVATEQPYVTFQVWMKDDLAFVFKAKAEVDGVSQSALLATALQEHLAQLRP
jgi:hypothetical protein